MLRVPYCFDPWPPILTLAPFYNLPFTTALHQNSRKFALFITI